MFIPRHQRPLLQFSEFPNVIYFYSILWQSDVPVFTTAAGAHFRNTVVILVHKTVKAVICWIKLHFTNHYFQLPLFHFHPKHVNEAVMKLEKWPSHVKWKICNKYHENAPLWAILGVKYISGWGCSKWRTHRGLMELQTCFSL